MTDLPTPETMEAECKTSIAMDRARGVPLPDDDVSDIVYGIGFAAGAQWAIDIVKGLK